MKLLTATAIAIMTATTAFSGALQPSSGLKALAEGGFGERYAEEIGGLAFNSTGGGAGFFTYDIPIDLSAARELLEENEFLAPHFAVGPSGHVYTMIAPSLLDGRRGPPDHFIVITPEGAERYDYSKDIE